MDINLILTIVAIVITIILGGYGIIIINKNKYKGKLDLIVEKNINLYDSIVKNIDDLKILYKNNPIKQNMNLLKIFLVNSGVRDLSPGIIEKYPTIYIGKDSTIHNVNIISKSNELNVKCEIDDNNIKIKNGLIRRDEYIYLEILVETKEKISPEDIIQFKYRISDFEETKPRLKESLQSRVSLWSFVFISILIGTLMPIILSNPLKINKYKLITEIETSDTSIVFSYFDLSYELKTSRDIQKSTLFKAINEFENILENYNYLDFIFELKPTKYEIDQDIVRFTYQNTFALVYGLLFLISIIMIPSIFLLEYVIHKQNRKLLWLINYVINEVNTPTKIE